MPGIVTITFSPCIDKSTSVASLVPEKKLKCSSPRLEPGGGGINVARAIHKLGGNATAIFPSGGYTGNFFNHLVQEENIPSVIIETINETRENFIVFDESTNCQFRFGMPGTTLSEKESYECLNAIEKINDIEFIIASGSIPPGMPADIFTKLARIARNKNAKFIADTSGEALCNAAREGAYLLKPNLNELCALGGKETVKAGEVENLAKKILAHYPIEILVVSLGSNGALLVTANKTYKVLPPPVYVKSTVGAGDSMLAGIVLCLSKKMSLEECLQYGVASGTAATMNRGTELCNKQDADFLFQQIQLHS